jgi:hypothetical protein
MAIKKIRLTESQLTSLIKRIVEDTENDMGMEMGMNFNDEDDSDMTKQDAIELIADFFEEDVLPELTPRETRELKNKARKPHSRSMHEEEETNLRGRMSNFKNKMMVRGGLGMAATGAIGAISEFTGWSESEMLTKIHEFFESAGAGNYTGPITIAMVAAGLALALKGKDMEYRKSNR